MSKVFDEIQKPLLRELKIFDERFKESLKTQTPLLDRIMHYIVQRKGKQMRPLFVFMSARLAGGNIDEPTYGAATLVELLHTATLVHDDVVDDSNERRGFFSINYLWKNKIAVLVGDYLLSRGLLLSVKNNQFEVLRILSEAVEAMSEGELLQIEKARKLDIKEEVYFEIIRKKTATLIASACAAGAASVSSDANMIERLKKLGEKTGIAFQIKDDLFDFGSDDIGKPHGIDIKERKMTLPLIYALHNTDEKTRRHIIYIVKNNNEDSSKVNEVIDFVRRSGGLSYAEKEMNRIKDEALEILHEFEPSDVRTAFEQLIDYSISRKK